MKARKVFVGATGLMLAGLLGTAEAPKITALERSQG